jgi:hypothetical protein
MAGKETLALALAEAGWEECRLVHEFLNQRVRPHIVQAVEREPSTDSDTFHGEFLRLLAWMRTLWKLNEPADFQAASGATRALLEIAIDVALMHFEESSPPAKLLAWEESAKLKATVKIRDYFAQQGLEPPTDKYAHEMAFLARHSKRIEELRATHWPVRQKAQGCAKRGDESAPAAAPEDAPQEEESARGRHPRDRWTGRNLEADAAKATDLFPDGKFAEFYATRYQQLCWNTHVLGLAGIRGLGLEVFPGLLALAFGECARPALAGTKVILLHFKLWDGVVADFDRLRENRTLVKGAVLAKHGNL